MTIGIDTHARHIAKQGYTIVEGAIEPDLVDALDDDLLRLEHDLGIVPAHNTFEGLHTVRIYNLLAHGPHFEQIPVHPAILPLCEQVLDPGLLVSSLSSIAIGPEESPQPIHADDQVIPLPKPHPATVCNTMWALTDFTEENGATRIIPGSHLADESPDFGRHYDSIPAEMPKGSVLVWHGSLWHGGGANTTSERRVGIAMNYCAGYIRQQENQQLGLPSWWPGSPTASRSWSGTASTRDLSAISTRRCRPIDCCTPTPSSRCFGTWPNRRRPDRSIRSSSACQLDPNR
jgi:ectoine hydroxylase-related dioxygenase (phytanoyl-CoA dioxygenase family)